MIRWKYLLPRLLLLAIVVVAYGLGFDPLARWALTTAGQSATGAKVDVGGLETHLVGTAAELHDVQVADPRKPLQNLVEARSAHVDFDGWQLLRKRFVIDEASLRGLRIGGDRENSGRLQPQPESAASGGNLTAMLEQLAGDWAEGLDDNVRADLEQNLQSVHLARQMSARWPAEYERLAARADEIQRRVGMLQQTIENVGSGRNPLRTAEAVHAAARELEVLRGELPQVQAELERLHGQATRDRAAIAAARQHDMEQIRQRVDVGNLDAETISSYLLGSEVGGRVASVLQWVEWGRQHMPNKTEVEAPVRDRGRDIVFPSLHPYPDFLVRGMTLQGEARLDGQMHPFVGRVTALSSQPGLYNQPTSIKLEAGGATPMLVHAILDHRGDVPVDRILIDSPAVAQPQRTLGDPDELAITVSPGNAHLWVQLDLRDDALVGQIVLKQDSVELIPTLGPRYGGRRVGESLQAAMRDVHHLHATVDLAGTLQRPQMRLRSNIGPQLVAGLQGVLHHEVGAQREALAARVDQEVQVHLASFDELVKTKQQEVLAHLQIGNEAVEKLQAEVAGKLRLPNQLLGRQPEALNRFLR